MSARVWWSTWAALTLASALVLVAVLLRGVEQDGHPDRPCVKYALKFRGLPACPRGNA